MAVTIGRFSIRISASAQQLYQTYTQIRQRTSAFAGNLATGFEYFSFRPLIRNLQSFNRNLDNTISKLQGIARAGVVLTTALVAPLALSVRTASDFRETTTRFDAIFKDNADTIREWGQAYADSTQRAQSTVLDFLSLVRNRFSSFDDIVGSQFGDAISQALTQASVDLSSFFNVAQQQTNVNLLSGLAGETEALRKYAINIDEATLKQQAFIAGFEDYAGLDQNIKVLLRARAILTQLGDAQNDAIRTAGEFANSQRGLSADIKNLRVEIGNQLIPMLTEWLTKIRQIVTVTTDYVKNNKEAVASVVTLAIRLTLVTAAVVGVVVALRAISLISATVVTAISVMQSAIVVFAAIVSFASGGPAALALTLGGIFVAGALAAKGIDTLVAKVKEGLPDVEAFRAEFDKAFIEPPKLDIETNTEQIKTAVGEIDNTLDGLSKKEIEIKLSTKAAEEAKKEAEKIKRALESEAERLTQSLRTPFEKFTDGVSRLRELIRGTSIDETTANRQVAALRRQLIESQDRLDKSEQLERATSPSLITRGSSADAALRAAEERATENARRQRQQQLDEQRRNTTLNRKANDTLRDILQGVRSQTNGQKFTFEAVGIF